MAALILIVDDDPVQRRLLESMARRFGHSVETLDSGEAALQRMTAADRPPVGLLILDLVMPDLDGMGVLTRMRQHKIAVPTIVQTAHGSIETVISAMRAGALDFVVKPVGAERLQASIKNALRVEALEGELRRASRRSAGEAAFRDLATSSDQMARTLRLAERAAKSHIPVLIEGEPGAGKELLARSIHGASDRRGRPFVTVSCALPDETALLFGCEKGADPGAPEKQAGKFALAHGGTLFLDEIGELTPDGQARLLRALQEGEIEPVGARRPLKVDVRLICAWRRDLIELVKAGRFREDLFYRLNVFPISIPPLRARNGDIPALAARFLARFSVEEGKRLSGLTAEAHALLAAYDWPGNVRQLENAVFRAVALADGDELTVAEFPQIAARIAGFDVRIPPAPPPVATLPEPAPRMTMLPLRDPHALRLIDENGDVRTLEAIEAEAIRFALAHYRGQMSQVARKLGIGRSTLYRKMKDNGIAEDLAPDAAA